MISDWWGHYVSVLHYPAKDSAVVMRSPVSRLPCFKSRHEGITIFFSNLDDFASLQAARLSVNWASITAQVVGGDYITNETALEGVDSVECGEAVECRSSSCATRSYWDPRSFLEDRSISNFDEATRAIRTATDNCVSALSSAHKGVLMRLSGGLDSSIVLSSLSRAPHKPFITAVNYYSPGSGDERRFARSMARRAKVQILERLRNEHLDLHRFLDCNRTVRPVLNFSAPDVEARNIALARELKASAILDGELGDNIFGSQPTPGAIVECVNQTGLGRTFLSHAVDYSMLTKQSLWRTLSSARAEARKISGATDFKILAEMQRHYGTDGLGSVLLASAAAQRNYGENADRFLHPWLKGSRSIAPGSHMLLFGLIAVTSTSYHSPFTNPSDPPQLSPLASQPLVEIALRIPAYLHCKAAQDRAVARSAFADALPPEIINRGQGKGISDLWAKAVVENNTEFLREFLLDGVLAKTGLIDREKVNNALSPRIVKSGVIVGDIFAKLYIESWLRTVPGPKH
jgi:asparagine synthase (glutamine-hydrolysing)